MDKVYIRVEDYVLLKKYFDNKDLVSVEDLIGLLDDLTYDVEKLKEEYEDLVEDVRDNYKFVGMREAVGYNENW